MVPALVPGALMKTKRRLYAVMTLEAATPAHREHARVIVSDASILVAADFFRRNIRGLERLSIFVADDKRLHGWRWNWESRAKEPS